MFIPKWLFSQIINIVDESKGEVIRHLSNEVTRLREENLTLRRRADLAVDALLKAEGKQPVMPEKFSFPTPEEAERVSKRQKEIEALKNELERVGDASGSPDPGPGVVEEIV